MEPALRSIINRLSLRKPQADSFQNLAWALEELPALRDPNARSEEALKQLIEALKAQFPTVTDFEREFPSLCFALATGVGKTRLMGAFIAYLPLPYGINHFSAIPVEPKS